MYEKAKAAEALAHLRKLSPDFLVVVSFGHLLSREFLGVPAVAPLNIHPSLLPRHRGASPMPWTILEGDEETGVTIIRMNERMDAGDIAAQQRIPVGTDDLPALEARLREVGARLIVDTLDRWENNAVQPVPQDESKATYTKKFSKEDARLDFSQPAEVLARRVRALKGWPGTYAPFRGKRLLVHAASASAGSGRPGAALRADAAGIEIGTGRGALVVTRVQLEGKKEMAAGEFLRGFPVKPGDSFE